ncbi:MAG: ATP-binding cassette domain-containing protein [Holosporaceae bacterium]|jgi:ATPase subunit of ABC transporter with duplicated ATPase domains|nr:ATP-binding cassette domain-containing protein [Holosporaceae bacterium]
MHDLVQIKNFSLSFQHKICFENFSTQVLFGNRIGIIGRNGIGKSSLLKMITEQNPDIATYVPQIIDNFAMLSGGQRFNKALSTALGKNPLMLLLDEPTNHLDLRNRQSLMRMLDRYCGTLIIVTHDRELLRRCANILWHIDNGKITIFHGNYDDYIIEMRTKHQSIVHQLESLKREKKSLHQDLMHEQERVTKSKSFGKKKVASKRWIKSVGDLKAMKAEKSHGNKLKTIDKRKQNLSEQLSEIRLPEIITPKFYVAHRNARDKILVSIIDGSVAYANKIILKNINLSICSVERTAIVGDNGSGKTTLVRAILGDCNVIKSGHWHVPHSQDIGYLDQHYENLIPWKSAVEIISAANPEWNNAEIRRHLNDFLFRKNEEVNTPIKNLSGGERVRLSLAKIAAHPPKLLILDEITNNIDLETRNHVTEILLAYSAAMIIISHDEDFLNEIGIENKIETQSCLHYRT